MAVKKTTQPTEIKIANTLIEIGEIYELGHKFDGSASDGMQELGATKYPLEGVAEKRGIPFDENRNAFDTGFYEESICNGGMLKTENKKEVVRLYNQLVRDPFEKRMNVTCSESNIDFWKSYKYEVKVNKSFDTSDPIRLFELFHILKQGAACNEGEKDSVLQKARYTIKNLAATKNKEDKVLDDKIKAIFTFNTLLDSDIEKAYTILEYLQASNPRAMQKDVLKRTYTRILDDTKKGGEFVRRFLEASDKYNTEIGKLEMQYFTMAQKLVQKGGIVKKAGSFFHKDGTYLANSTKDIGIKASMPTEKDFAKIIEDLYEEYNK